MTRFAIVVGLVLGVAAVPAHADRADQLFKKGKRLLADKRYPEACAAFEASDRLDPGIGAKLNVARCYEEWGKLATAWRWYADAEQMARAANDDRAGKIRTLIEELDPKVPRLTVLAPPGADLAAVVVKLDDAPFARTEIGVERRVDPGPHQIDYVVDGSSRRKTIPVERGSSAEVMLELTARPPGERARGDGADDDDPGSTRRWAGVGVGAVGLVAVGVAGIVTWQARGDYRDALADHCRGATDMCDPEGLTATRDARRTANIATGVAIAGAAAVGAGVVLYLLAPRARRDEHALRVVPSIDRDGGGLVVRGAF